MRFRHLVLLAASVSLLACGGGSTGMTGGGAGGSGGKGGGKGGGTGGAGMAGGEGGGEGGGMGGGMGGGSGGDGGVEITPDVPQGLTAVAGDGQVTLDWTPVAGATRYHLYWLTSATVAKTHGSKLTVMGAPPFVHVGPSNGNPYSYVVTAANSGGESAESNVATATPLIIDLTAPTVATSRPRAAEAAVSLKAGLTLRFSEALDPSTVSATTVTFATTGGAVAGTRTLTGDLLTFVPAAPLAPQTAHTLTVTTGAKDLGGNALAANFVLTFTTASAAPTGLVAIQGAGDATLTWTATAAATGYILSRATAVAGPYADVASTKATFATERAIALGTAYSYAVSAITASGRSEPSAPLTFTPSAVGAAAPINVTVLAAKTTALLAWSAVTSALSYNVLRASTPAGPFTQVANVTNVAFLDTGLNPATTYFYVVQTVIAGGTSPYSTEVTCALSSALPSAPTALTASAGNTWAELNWSAVGTATRYLVYRQNAVNQAFTGPISVTANNLVLTGLSNGTTYNFLVAAVSGTDAGDWSPVSVTPGPALAPRPAIATGAFGRVNGVTVLFELSAGYTSNTLLRSTTSGGPYTAVGTTGLDNTALPGVTYFYVVRAQNNAVNAAVSNEVSGVAQVATTLLAPTGVAATPGNGSVMINWSPVPGAVSYVVSSSTTSGGPYSGATCVATNETRCNVTVANGTLTHFIVRAQGPTLPGPNSAQVSATALGTLPLAPGATLVSGNGGIRLTWPAITGAMSYRVYRRTPLTDWAQLSNPTGPSYVDLVTNSLAYHYAIQAVGTGGGSVWGNLGAPAVWATPYAPSIPANVAATQGNGALMVSWNPVPGAASYNVISSLSAGGPYNQASCATSDTRCVLGGTNGTAYYVVVIATGPSATVGAPSAELSATPLSTFAVPPAATFTGGNTAVAFAWNAVPTATGYRVYRRTTQTDWKLAGTTAAVSFVDPLANGVPYFYAFQTSNAGGDGAWAIPSSGARVASTLVPVAPSGVTAIPGNGTTTVLWQAVTDATSYLVTSALAPGGPYTAGTCTAMGDTHCNLTPANGTPLYVVVTSSGGGGAGTPSTEVMFTAQSSAPVIPVVTPVAGNNANVLSWPRVTVATAYKVHRRLGTGPWVEVGTQAAATFFDDDALNGEAYRYAVQPMAAAVSSAWSVTTAVVTATNAVPPPPKLTIEAGNAAVTVRWAPVAGASQYTLRTSTVQGGPYMTACAPASLYETVCTVAMPNGASAYVVGQSGNVMTLGSYSPEVSAPPSAMLPIASNPNATIVAGKVHLAWVAGSGGANRYRVFRRLAMGPPAYLAEVPGLAFDDEVIPAGVARYWIQAVNATGPGQWTAAVQITTP